MTVFETNKADNAKNMTQPARRNVDGRRCPFNVAITTPFPTDVLAAAGADVSNANCILPSSIDAPVEKLGENAIGIERRYTAKMVPALNKVKHKALLLAQFSKAYGRCDSTWGFYS